MSLRIRAVVAAIVISSGGLSSATTAAHAQTTTGGGDPTTAPCFDGAPPRPRAGDASSAFVSGCSPVGRCEPTSAQRAADNFILVWILGLLGVGAVTAIRWAVRRPGERPLPPPDDSGSPPVAAAS